MEKFSREAVEKGIESVLQELQLCLGKPIIVWRADFCVWPQGHELSWAENGSRPYPLPEFRKEEYYYRQRERLLYLRYGRNSGNIVEIARVEKSDISVVLKEVEARREALDLCDLIACQADAINNGYQQILIGRLLHSSARIQEIFDLYGIRLPTEKPSRILVGRFSDRKECSEETFSAWKKKISSLGKKALSPPILWEGRILWNVSMDLSPDDIQKQLNLNRGKSSDIEAGELYWGIGSVYDWRNLHRSYLEASIAWGLGVLHQGEPLCFFEDLGTEQLLFSQSLATLREYVHQTFDVLWESDQQNRQQLFPTLQKLVRTDFSISRTAAQLELHVNTIRYRMGRIEELLHTQLDSYHTRGNLIAAFTVWEVLDITGFMKSEDVPGP